MTLADYSISCNEPELSEPPVTSSSCDFGSPEGEVKNGLSTKTIVPHARVIGQRVYFLAQTFTLKVVSSQRVYYCAVMTPWHRVMFVWAPLVMRTSADGLRPDTANEIYTASSLLPIYCQMIILTSLHLVKIIRNLIHLFDISHSQAHFYLTRIPG